MTGRITSLLVWHLITSVAEEVGLAVILLWGLPQIGVEVPAWVIPPALVAMVAYNVFTYRKANQAFRAKPMVGLPDMCGSRGEVVTPLAPAGQIKIKGELWTAEAENGEMAAGRMVIVVKQSGLRLVVRGADQTVAENAA